MGSRTVPNTTTLMGVRTESRTAALVRPRVISTHGPQDWMESSLVLNHPSLTLQVTTPHGLSRLSPHSYFVTPSPPGFIARSHLGTFPFAWTRLAAATGQRLHTWPHRSSVPSVYSGRELLDPTQGHSRLPGHGVPLPPVAISLPGPTKAQSNPCTVGGSLTAGGELAKGSHSSTKLCG